MGGDYFPVKLLSNINNTIIMSPFVVVDTNRGRRNEVVDGILSLKRRKAER